MKIPHAEQAVLDIRKLENYCLDPTHLRGRHKAQIFRSALGIGRSDSEWLRQELLRAVRGADAEPLADAFGTQWRVDIPVTRQDRRTVVRTIWITRTGEDIPRFVTCWVL